MTIEKPRNSPSFFRRKSVVVWLFNIPAYSLILIFTIAPMVYSFYVSLHHWDLARPPITFVGLSNYVSLFQSEFFWLSLKNTIIFTAGSVTIGFFLSLFLALLLNESFKGVTVARSLAILPWTIPPLITGIMWIWIFNAKYGIVNYVLLSLGIIKENVLWLAVPNLAMISVIVARSFSSVPFQFLLLLAGLQGIPVELYDAAKVDGANIFHRFQKITLPLLRNQILLVLVFSTMSAFRTFALIYAMTFGGPGNATAVLGFFVYKLAFLFYDFGKGAAAAFILGIMVMAIAVVYIKLFFRRIEY